MNRGETTFFGRLERGFSSGALFYVLQKVENDGVESKRRCRIGGRGGVKEEGEGSFSFVSRVFRRRDQKIKSDHESNQIIIMIISTKIMKITTNYTCPPLSPYSRDGVSPPTQQNESSTNRKAVPHLKNTVLGVNPTAFRPRERRHECHDESTL